MLNGCELFSLNFLRISERRLWELFPTVYIQSLDESPV